MLSHIERLQIWQTTLDWTGYGTSWGLQQAWPCLLLPLALLPWCLRGQRAMPHPYLAGLPEDRLSVWLERSWRLALTLLCASLLLALSRPYLTTQHVERLGRGAHVMIVLDRSASMNDPFAKRGDADARVPKMQAARSLLQSLVAQGKDDLIGMVTFSTSPILAAPLSTDRGFVQAALQATEAGGMGFTAVARGLGMALDYYGDQAATGSRAVVLVSDGGAHLDGKTQDMLRAMFMRQQASLYWIYLRSENGVSLRQTLAEGESIDAYPEVALDAYFQTLHVPYRVYEAENPQAVAAAIADIARLKNKPTRYSEPLARLDISHYAYVLAVLAALLLCLMHTLELEY